MGNETRMVATRQRNKAFRSAKAFANAEARMRTSLERREKALREVGGREDEVWRFAWALVLVGALGLGIFAAFTAQTALAGFVDPMGDGTIPSFALAFIGVSMTLCGMWFGKGMYESVRVDEYSGRHRVEPMFLLFLLASLGYIGFQYAIAKGAGGGLSADQLLGAENLPLVIAGVAVLEVLVGVLLLPKAVAYMSMFLAAVTGMRWKRAMDREAQATHEGYDYYVILLNAHNTEYPQQRMEQEGNENVRRAIAYYNSVILPDSSQPTDRAAAAPSTNGTVNQDNAPGGRRTVTEQAEQNRPIDVSSIIDDGIDDDLTV